MYIDVCVKTTLHYFTIWKIVRTCSYVCQYTVFKQHLSSIFKASYFPFNVWYEYYNGHHTVYNLECFHTESGGPWRKSSAHFSGSLRGFNRHFLTAGGAL